MLVARVRLEHCVAFAPFNMTFNTMFGTKKHRNHQIYTQLDLHNAATSHTDAGHLYVFSDSQLHLLS